MAPDERTSLLPTSQLSSNPIKRQEDHPYSFPPGSAKNPRNWKASKKWLVTLLASMYGLIGPALSAMVVPVLPQIAVDLQLRSEATTQMVMSLTVLGWSLGPLLLAPLSEQYGRAPVLNCAQFLFLVTNTMSALEWNGTRFLVLRFLAGFIGSAPVSIGSGMVSDMFSKEERGKSLATYTIVPLLAPAVGPIVGAFVSQYASWRWILHTCSIYTLVTLVLGLIFIEESFAPVLLRRERDAHPESSSKAELTVPQNKQQSFLLTLARLARNDISRPFIMLGTQPIIQFLAVYMSLLFGLVHMTIATFHTIWRDVYAQPPTTASLNYISIAAGFVIGCQAMGYMNDKIYAECKLRRLKSKSDSSGEGADGVEDNGGRPEFRTYAMLPAGLVLLPLGELLYGFSVACRLHPLYANVGIALHSAGLIGAFQCITAYVLDCYPVYAASAVSALMPLRGVTGGVFPILGPRLYRELGYEGTAFLLAGVLAFVGLFTPLVLMRWGPALRARSTFAAGKEAKEGL